jgi:hypothetical protein
LFKGLNKNTFSGCGGGGVVIFGIKTASFLNPGDLVASWRRERRRYDMNII